MLLGLIMQRTQALEYKRPIHMRTCHAWLAKVGNAGKVTERIRQSAQRVIVFGTPLLAVKYPSGTRTLIVYPDGEYRSYCEDDDKSPPY